MNVAIFCAAVCSTHCKKRMQRKQPTQHNQAQKTMQVAQMTTDMDVSKKVMDTGTLVSYYKVCLFHFLNFYYGTSQVDGRCPNVRLAFVLC